MTTNDETQVLGLPITRSLYPDLLEHGYPEIKQEPISAGYESFQEELKTREIDIKEEPIDFSQENQEINKNTDNLKIKIKRIKIEHDDLKISSYYTIKNDSIEDKIIKQEKEY